MLKQFNQVFISVRSRSGFQRILKLKIIKLNQFFVPLGCMHGLTKLFLLLLFSLMWKIVCNTMLYMFFFRMIENNLFRSHTEKLFVNTYTRMKVWLWFWAVLQRGRAYLAVNYTFIRQITNFGCLNPYWLVQTNKSCFQPYVLIKRMVNFIHHNCSFGTFKNEKVQINIISVF